MSGTHSGRVALQNPLINAAGDYLADRPARLGGYAADDAPSAAWNPADFGTIPPTGATSNGVSITGTLSHTRMIARSSIGAGGGAASDLATPAPPGAVLASGTTSGNYYHTVILNSPSLQNPATVGIGGLIHAYYWRTDDQQLQYDRRDKRYRIKYIQW